jgi:hypothetical protein
VYLIFRPLSILFLTLVRSKLEYASVVWDYITFTDANKLEHIQQKFAALCFNPFFLYVLYSYAPERLKWGILSKRRHHLTVAFLFNTHLDSKLCLPFPSKRSILESLLRNMEDISLLKVCSSRMSVPLQDSLQLVMPLAGRIVKLYTITHLQFQLRF